MGLLLPVQRFTLTTPLPAEALGAAVRRLVRRAPAPRRSWEPERWLLGEVGDREVTLQPAPRLEDRNAHASWWYLSIGELAGVIEAGGSGSALAGRFRVREAAALRLMPLLAGFPGAIALLLLVLAAAELERSGLSESSFRSLMRLLLAPAAPFAFFRLLVQALFERDRRIVEALLREEIAAAEAGESGRAGAASVRPP